MSYTKYAFDETEFNYISDCVVGGVAYIWYEYISICHIFICHTQYAYGKTAVGNICSHSVRSDDVEVDIDPAILLRVHEHVPLPQNEPLRGR